ncbi:MAG: glucokinase [Proteobacteria bacterium]|nr:glucokinase [Pseudomonadota bacterium]
MRVAEQAGTSSDWLLVADVGGTNARFAVVDKHTNELSLITYYSVADHRVFTDALKQFLHSVRANQQWSRYPLRACLAVAGPVDKAVLKFTNSSWVIDAAAIATQLGAAPVHLINDFAAIGYATAQLTAKDYIQLGGGCGLADKPIAVLGDGTGLGACAVIPTAHRPTVVETEGGHVDFAPITSQEIAILNILLQRYSRVSYERLLSGSGIVAIYQALAELVNRDCLHHRPEEVYEAAIAGTDTLAMRTMQLFCAVLGSFAGNLALTMGARGGVFIAGGIGPKIRHILEHSEFRNRFESKGRLRDFLADIPVYLITASDVGLQGAAHYLRCSCGASND